MKILIRLPWLCQAFDYLASAFFSYRDAVGLFGKFYKPLVGFVPESLVAQTVTEL